MSLEIYKSIFTSGGSRSASFRWDTGRNEWVRTNTDPVMDVSDADTIYIQGDMTNSCGNGTVSTSVTIHVLAAWGSSANTTAASFTAAVATSYASYNMGGSSAVGGFLVNPGPELIKLRVSSLSSGGMGSTTALDSGLGVHVYTKITRSQY
jgi:hypothetical protein